MSIKNIFKAYKSYLCIKCIKGKVHPLTFHSTNKNDCGKVKSSICTILSFQFQTKFQITLQYVLITDISLEIISDSLRVTVHPKKS